SADLVGRALTECRIRRRCNRCRPSENDVAAGTTARARQSNLDVHATEGSMKQASSRILFALAVAAIPLSASADNAFTLRDVEVYTGPGSEYPPVATLPPNTGVDIAGCLSDWSWCDINFADSRGWVYAADLGYPYQNNRVVI